ncbi:hypothetical protein [Pseudoxanthomonas koreensis]|uniref:hypothetical protein n=1 Tax=Pseudoxanthomonas koreensis TaxID=266061 RepID=UPI001391B2DF|nr:hypothetical protein [Pseudoxanthomonas koreensis]KAF1690084.1 hypothetical protein CSC64_11925 [Pseudoxanthomonas koreensis]
MQDTSTTAAAAVIPDPEAPAVPAGAPELAPPLPERQDEGEPWVVRSWRLLLREPSLMVAVAYLFVSFIGLWASYWFYRMFGLPILEYMQASDYLVAGLRDPAYAALLGASVLLALAISWPELYRAREPQRVERLRRRWWGRAMFPEHRWMRWRGIGMAPVSGMVFAVFLGMVWACTAYVVTKAVNIRDDGSGNRVEVTLAGESAPLPGEAQLLGTTSAFVLLWWPQQQRAEAVPVAAVKRLASLRPPAPPPRLVAPLPARAAAAPAAETTDGTVPASDTDTSPPATPATAQEPAP